jgi:hypothetical protein
LTLFTTEKLWTTEVNDYLHSQWVTNLVSIASIIQLKEIPMLGTWKVDHVQLKSILQSWPTKQPSKTTSKSTSKVNEKPAAKEKSKSASKTKEKSSSSKKTKK